MNVVFTRYQSLLDYTHAPFLVTVLQPNTFLSAQIRVLGLGGVEYCDLWTVFSVNRQHRWKSNRLLSLIAQLAKSNCRRNRRWLFIHCGRIVLLCHYRLWNNFTGKKTVLSNSFFFMLWSEPPKGRRGCLMSPSCLESLGCHLIPLYYLLSCSSALSLFFLPTGPFSWHFFLQKILKYFLVKR